MTEVQSDNKNTNGLLQIPISRETALILQNIKQELGILYGENIQSTDDLILFLTNYYYKR